MKIHVLLSSLFAFCYLGHSYGQPGSLDPTFNIDGVVYPTLYEGFSSEAVNVLVQHDGKILATGSSDVPGGPDVALLIRYLPDGNEDLDFNEKGVVALSLPGISLYGMTSIQRPDGKILTLAGKNDNIENLIALFCTNTDGSPDTDFGTAGIVTLELPFSEKAPRNMARQNDGKLVICGYVKSNGDLFRKSMITRCMPDGSLDPDFNDVGYNTAILGTANGQTQSITIEPDGKIITAGYGVFNGRENIVVLRYMPDGTPDASFNEDGMARIAFSNADARARSVALQDDGKIVVGGFVRPVDSDADFVVVRINPDGKLDASFNEDGIAVLAVSPYSDDGKAMILQQDGKIVLGGTVHSNSPELSNSGLLRVTTDGYPDPTFADQGYFETDHFVQENFILGLASQPDGKIIAVGRINVGGFTKFLIARFITGLTVSTADPSPISAAVTVYPNPVIEELTIEYQLEKEETISIRLVDLHGRLIENLLYSANRQSGQHKETFSIDEGLPTGTYIVQMTTSKGMITHKIMVIRTDG